MKNKKNIKIPLLTVEKEILRKSKIKISNLIKFAADEIEIILHCGQLRAKTIKAIIEFQNIQSIGVKFAEDLVFCGYFSIDELKNKNGAVLCDEFEQKKGYWIDPCVEDQFRLIVYHANTGDNSKNWWDFTQQRKDYRTKYGYPTNRPTKAWFEFPL